MKVEIYTDGSSRNNPGPGGYGAILVATDKNGKKVEKEISAGYELTTNNRMEMLAAIRALQELKYPCDVDLYSDSKYLVDAHEKGWIDSWIQNGWKNSQKKDVKNIDLWKELLDASKSHNIQYIWVKGHAGHSYNERCDKLATEAADSDDLLIDEGYSNDI